MSRVEDTDHHLGFKGSSMLSDIYDPLVPNNIKYIRIDINIFFGVDFYFCFDYFLFFPFYKFSKTSPRSRQLGNVN